jgi:hypothetical protein
MIAIWVERELQRCLYRQDVNYEHISFSRRKHLRLSGDFNHNSTVNVANYVAAERRDCGGLLRVR